MSPVNDETDEGFVSPSVQRISKAPCEAKARLSESENSSDSGSQTESSSSQGLGLHSDESERPSNKSATNNKGASDTDERNSASGASNVSNSIKDAVETKAESLAKFIVYTLLGKQSVLPTTDKVESTLLRCVRMMMQKHEILFKGMMKRMQVTRETGYHSFVTVANTLFEDEKLIVTWGRIVALYAFGGQLALYCKEKDMEDLSYKIAIFMGKYSKEVLTPYITSIGGWGKICEEFPEDSDIENKIRRVLSWTAVGLGLAATLSYLTSR